MASPCRRRYLGLELEHPWWPPPRPLSQTLDGIRRSRTAAPRPSSSSRCSRSRSAGRTSRPGAPHRGGRRQHGEALSYFPPIERLPGGTRRVPGPDPSGAGGGGVPVIASLNGVTPTGWTDYARADAGGRGLAHRAEHLLHPADRPRPAARWRSATRTSSAGCAGGVHSRGREAGPVLQRDGGDGGAARGAGADGLVLFNRFYQPDFDLDALEVRPDLELSTPGRDPPAAALDALLHGSGGVAGRHHRRAHAREVVKYLLAGADVVMTTSALLRHGPATCARSCDGLRRGSSRWRRSRATSSKVELIATGEGDFR
jgi:dihydroorotate dehydrogenase (fumarate)